MAVTETEQEKRLNYIRSQVLRKFPLLGVTMSTLKTEVAVGIETAETDGETVYFSPQFMDRLSDEEAMFVYAHEVMHVAFNHLVRSKGHRHELWNRATDAVINQILKSENLPLAENGVDIAEAINHSAEEMYEKLLKEREEKKQQQAQQNGKGQSQRGESQKGAAEPQQGDADDDEENDDENEQVGHDSHKMWKKAIEKAEKEQQRQQQKEAEPQSIFDKMKDMLKKKKEEAESKEEGNDGGSSSDSLPQSGTRRPRTFADDNDFEKAFSQQNSRERKEMAEKIRRELERRKNFAMRAHAEAENYSLGQVGSAEAVLDWKKVLKKSIEEEEDRWSYRRSGADNDYMARVEELEDENRAETEVMLDVSGSVDEKLLREFLRQLKPIIKSSKLKVGCFDEYFYGLNEVKTDADIDNFKITARSQWTENWDLAVRSFSRKKEINKIVFTDGYPCPGNMPKEDLKNANVIWLVYGNRNFHPVCGKVIQVDRRQITQHYSRSSSRGLERGDCPSLRAPERDGR